MPKVVGIGVFKGVRCRLTEMGRGKGGMMRRSGDDDDWVTGFNLRGLGPGSGGWSSEGMLSVWSWGVGGFF